MQAQLTASTLDEETARAEVYGLLAALLYAAPSADLHDRLRVAVTQAPAAGALLESPWGELVAAAREQSLDEIRREYDALFGGVGKPEVYLFGSHYLSGFLNEKPLAALRTDLADLGLARDGAMSETEDHAAYLCEVMRYLIAGDDVEVANLTRQRTFFTRHVQPWFPMMCEAVMRHPKARFYRALCGFAQSFVSVETQGFDMLD
ncbi:MULTISPECIES: molecular chaperone [unclassified Polaromonas]|uniref:TorD/DmsD family molecular chaperone n=1 Tax=unclassified Polaromonas TaxID=2638319 RepID=UPI0018C97F25|nr:MULTISPECIES: molecular chaperone TorD family protein [unclassified Polaromonas]MBG6070359.1 TorA maturation chaperone TorD [Polaromonas sp. CG_9.7]MBG6112357.1 TorA maturation chaperone TorD [Polaromonas sp. CG_9.2]MDH6184003.1 TorA maturation chaperone TorD [Polaromonas sp. CG_23.6]